MNFDIFEKRIEKLKTITARQLYFWTNDTLTCKNWKLYCSIEYGRKFITNVIQATKWKAPILSSVIQPDVGLQMIFRNVYGKIY